MLTISSKSWHLKLVRILRTDDYKPRNLCGYFWQVVGTCATVPLLALLFVVAILAVGTWLAVSWLNRKLPLRHGKRERLIATESHLNLAWEWVKAKKQKVCPLIKVVETGEKP